MSRIRSIHPGFFTDEDLVSVSMCARLLFIGIGVEADDKGIFEWKPLTLKMRIFPADSVDVADMLAELVLIGAIRNFESGGKQYGAIRNFRKFQKPKTPNDIHPASAEILEFVGLVSENKGDKIDQFPRNGETVPQKVENAIQMEDGEEDGEEIEPNGSRESDDFSVHDFMESWNETASSLGLPQMAKLTPARKRAFQARKREWPDIEDWKAAFRHLRESPFLLGNGNGGWRADCDFFLQAKSFPKLVEGAYGKA